MDSPVQIAGLPAVAVAAVLEEEQPMKGRNHYRDVRKSLIYTMKSTHEAEGLKLNDLAFGFIWR